MTSNLLANETMEAIGAVLTRSLGGAIMKIAEVRRFALSLPEVTEEPHFHFSSFRIRGRIFATVPPGGSRLHVLVGETERDLMLAVAPRAYDKLWWGKKVVGLGVTLSRPGARDVAELLHSAWHRRAPRSVVRAHPVPPRRRGEKR